VLGARSKDVYPREVVISGSLNLGALSVMFHAHPPKGLLRSRHPILPRSDSAFPTVVTPRSKETKLMLPYMCLGSHFTCTVILHGETNTMFD
jgi:hypothetical protein